MSALTFTHIEDSLYAYFEDAACHDDDRSEVRRSDGGTWERGGYHSYMSSDQWEVLEGSDARRLENEYQSLVKEGAVEDIDARAENREWIPVGERLPDEGVDVLVVLPEQAGVRFGVYVARVSILDSLHGTFATHFGFGFEATHWMPLPKVPREGT